MRNQVEEGICFHGELIFNPIDAERQTTDAVYVVKLPARVVTAAIAVTSMVNDMMKLRNANWVWLVAVAALPLRLAYAQETSLPANLSPGAGEVVKLVQSGMGDDVVIAHIKNSQAVYNLSSNDILALKNAGFSSPVLTAIDDM